MKVRVLLQKRPEILLFVIVSLTPLLWFRSGYVIAKGDNFPSWVNSQETFSRDVYLWNCNNLGNANVMSSYSIYGLAWLALMSLGVSASIIQILTYIFFFMTGSIGSFYLTRIAYPKYRIAPFVASVFYTFNLFVLENILSIGMMWTYSFMPLLMSLMISIAKATVQHDRRKANKYILYFAVISTVFFSFSSINLADMALVLLVLSTVPFYFIVTQKCEARHVIVSHMKLAVVVILLNVWWIIPTLNFYLWSSSTITSEVNVASWSWTHVRSSFLNLFWLNGEWGWRLEYVPYIYFYSNPVVQICAFFPFLLAGAGFLYRTKELLFNTYLVTIISIFLFLAKGVHEPLGQLNLVFYQYIPGMNMFREPVSKFTMALMPFLALLIGYAVHHITKMNLHECTLKRISKKLFLCFFVLSFIVASLPIIINPVETKTSQIPFSSYVRIPDYWVDATQWLNQQPGFDRVLVTPPDDFYMMPYSWNYYGTDGWLTRFLKKPVLAYYFGYQINSEIYLTLQHLYDTIRYNETSEFQAFLDLLNVKYILQRNDVQYNLTGRNIMAPNEMQSFLRQQSCLTLVKTFGQLDIYEYLSTKPFTYIIDPTVINQVNIRIQNNTIENSWSFSSATDIEEWQNATQPTRWRINYTIAQDDTALRAELWNSTQGWKTINSPLIPVRYGSVFQVQMDIKGQNAHRVHIKTVELDEQGDYIKDEYSAFVNDGTFNWTHVTYSYRPTSKNVAYVQVLVWHGHNTTKPLPNIIWVDNVQLRGYATFMNVSGLGMLFPNTTQNQPATIMSYERVTPARITAIVNASGPFILAISEALDGSWTAYVNGQQYKPIPLYLCITGFQINQTGSFEVTIEYEPQRWFFYGSTISVTTFLACLVYATYGYSRGKGVWKRVKHVFIRNKQQQEMKVTTEDNKS